MLWCITHYVMATPPAFMRILFLLLTALSLSLLSLGMAVDARAGTLGAAVTADAASLDLSAAASGDFDLAGAFEEGIVIAPGDDGVLAEEVVEEGHPGYCNIWSADLLDPPDVLDELEESSALFVLPVIRPMLPAGDITLVRTAQIAPPPATLFKPPIHRA